MIKVKLSPDGDPEFEFDWISASHPADHGLLLKGEVTDPPSLKGRPVMVVIPPHQLTLLLKEARDAAIAARSKPMGGHVPETSTPEPAPDPKAAVST